MAEFKKLINPPIKASEIDSESATSGQVLTANGTGGASWQNASGGGSIPNGFEVSIQGRGYGAKYELWYLGKLRDSITIDGTTYNTNYGYNVIRFSDQQTFYIDNCIFCILKMQEVGGAITPYVSVSLDAVVNGTYYPAYNKDITASEALTVNLMGNCVIVCGDNG